MPRILVAPDKFKGSLSASDVAAALRRGLLRTDPSLEVACLPVADGGEGTLDAALAAGFHRVPVSATGPLGAPVDTAYARRGETAVIEMADACGLARLPQGVLAAGDATSRAVGELIAAAMQAGCRHVILGIGGSASTDGGAGVVEALGARLLAADGRQIRHGGFALQQLHRLDLGGLGVPDGYRIVVAGDVDNPLTGPEGAAAIYGPQKGASPDDVRRLDAALAHWADMVADATGRDLRAMPGAGAAGGVGFAACALLGAELRSGVELMLELLDFETAATGADLVIVGEGSLDAQSLHGKAPMGVAAAAGDTPVVAVCGRLAVEPDQLRNRGIHAVHTLLDLQPDPQLCMRQAEDLLEVVGARIGVELASALS